MLGIWTKLKYQSNPIHIIATITCMYLNNQLQNNPSNAIPSFKKNNPKNKSIARANEAWIVFDNDDNKLLMILNNYTLK